MADEATVATLNTVMTGDTAPYQRELKKAEQLTEDSAKKIGTAGAGANLNLERAGRAATASAGAIRSMNFDNPVQAAGSLSQSLAAIPGPVTAITAGLVGVGAALANLVGGSSQFEKSMEAAGKILQGVASGGVTQKALIDKAAAEDSAKALEKYTERMVDAEKALRGIGTVQALQNDRLRLQTAAGDELVKTLQDQEAGLGNTRRAMEELIESQKKLGDNSIFVIKSTRGVVDSVDEQVKALEKQKRMLGETADSAEKLALIEKFMTETGLSEAEAREKLAPTLNRLTAAEEGLRKEREKVEKAQKQQEELKNAYEQTEKSLKSQISTLRLGADAAAIQQLKEQGLNEFQIKKIRALQEEKDKIQAINKVRDEAKEITESARSPLEKFTAEQEKLTKLFKSGAIDQRTFDRALLLAGEAMEKTGDKAKEAAKEIQKFDSAASGSAEALARIGAFEETIGRRGQKPQTYQQSGQDVKGILGNRQQEADAVKKLLERIAKAQEKANQPGQGVKIQGAGL